MVAVFNIYFFFFFTILKLNEVQTHVALTFPPARRYALDFLDTFRTPSPCGGMTRREELKTSIEAGKPLEITWHLGYWHDGGFKLELYDSHGHLVRYLTPEDQFVGGDDPKTQSYTTNELPSDLRCENCFVRLERQALNWGPNYRFQSCADVDIVPSASYRERCQDRGTPGSSRCICQRTYRGDHCQYKDDCEDDSDCNYNGECVDLKGSSWPRKQCFCRPPFFGVQCEKMSSNDLRRIDETSLKEYNSVNLGSKKINFYYRSVANGTEMEGVIVGKTLSYVAIGWKPVDIEGDNSCQIYPGDVEQPSDKRPHVMNCLDVVFGSARGSTSRVLDLYTRDRSTPMLDTVFEEGQYDLSGAMGYEEDGMTTIIFRRKYISEHFSDHDFSGHIVLAFAMGRDDDNFYAQDELKYHGSNRGHVRIHVQSAGQRSESSWSLLVTLTLSSFAILSQSF